MIKTLLGNKTTRPTLSAYTGLITAVMLVSATLQPAAWAATQGTIGATSTGSITISVTKTARARISNLNDMTLAAWEEANGTVQLTDDVCIYSTRPNGTYTIRADGSGPSNGYMLANGGNLLPYTVTWNAGGVGALSNTGIGLTPHITSSPFTKASTTSPTCSDGDNARIIVGISSQNMSTAVEGSYVGVLTLLVSPN